MLQTLHIEINVPVIGQYIGYNDEFTSIELPKPVRSGYAFKGWFFDTACTKPVQGKANVDNYVVEVPIEDANAVVIGYEYEVTLYAKWVEIVADAVDQIEGLLDKIDKDPANKLVEITTDNENWPNVIDVLINVAGICDGSPVIDEEAINGLTTKVIEYINENYPTINTVIINGVKVVENKVIKNKAEIKVKESFLLKLNDGEINELDTLTNYIIKHKFISPES